MPQQTPTESRNTAADTTTEKRRARIPQVTTSPTIDEADTSRYMGFSIPWLRVRRRDRTGPAFVKAGRAIRYRIADLDAWLTAHRVETRDSR